MIQRCIFNFVIIFSIGIFSCNVKDDFPVEYEEFDFAVVQTIKLIDNKGFYQKLDNLQLVSDSIIVAFSGLSGLSFYNHVNGEQIEFIDPRSNPKRALFFSSFDASDFPNIYLLEARQNKVFVYNFENNEFIKEIALDLDLGSSIRVLGGKFKSYKDHFYIELNPEGTSVLDPSYYKNSGAFLGVFDSEGNLKRRVIEYPDQLVNPKGYFIPADYYSFDIFDDKLYICFPFEKIIRIYDLNSDFSEFKSISIPQLDYMEFDLISIPNKFIPQEIPVQNRQISAKVNRLLIDDTNIYISFSLNDNKNSDRFRAFSSVFKLDLVEMKWWVQRDPIDYFDIGIFAGSLNEELIFLDAALIIKDEKFINKAVIKHRGRIHE